MPETPSETEPPNALWRYVPTLRREDEIWRQRIVLHDFGLVWEDTPVDERSALVAKEPDSIDPRWDAFLAAYVAHRCEQDGIEAPVWVHDDGRFLPEFWFAGGCPEYDRERTLFTTPLAFRARGVWYPEEEMLVV